jgi:uncharacterized SAM-binding protein YcdF (DUF218 family)
MTAVLFVYPDFNAPERSDAIVVLGGHGAPAFDKGAELAKEGYAPDLVLSIGPGQHCEGYQRFLATRRPDVKVTCFVPNPQTTQGEGRAIAQLSKKLDWKRIIVVVPTSQATRARLRVGRCYPGQVLEVAFSPQGIGEWLTGIVYEWGALLKALILQPTC